MRLIDADKLCESIMKVWDFAEENGQKKLANAIADVLVPAIVSQPTVEAELIKHGHWTRVDYYPVGHDYICSICDRKHSGSFNFCPDCGAKMDEEVEE